MRLGCRKEGYALGGGGSGDLVMDRNSFTTQYGLSRSDNDKGPVVVAVAPIAIGKQETIAEQSPGVDGTGQPGRGGAPLSRSTGPWPCIPAISCISAFA